MEKEAKIAAHQTGNNSGVIHSGIYYKPGSLKATNCIRGYHQLIEFCTINNVPFELCGKIIVATSKEELTALENTESTSHATPEGMMSVDRALFETITARLESLEKRSLGANTNNTNIKINNNNIEYATPCDMCQKLLNKYQIRKIYSIINGKLIRI